MNGKTIEFKEIELSDLIPFTLRESQIYHGQRLEQFKDSIIRMGLLSPIIVRPIENGKHEIIVGHNRVKACGELGHKNILADIRYELSDEKALEIYYDSNMNQQSFADWHYSQKIEAIKYSEKLIKENSKQGKRTDLQKKNADKLNDETSVYNKQKSDDRSTTRDKMAKRLGISTATLSKYRSIIKIPDEMIEALISMLDVKRISFECIYQISKLKSDEIKILVTYLHKNRHIKPDVGKLKILVNMSKSSQINITSKDIQKVFLSDDLQKEDENK